MNGFLQCFGNRSRCTTVFFRNRLLRRLDRCIGSRFLTDVVEIDFTQRFKLLLLGRFEQALCPIVFGLSRRLLIFGLLREKAFGLATDLCILLEGFDQRLVLGLTEFETQFVFHFSQFVSFLQELNGRLKSDV